MKMKEKKEEIVEEVVEVNNELLDYLEFTRQCMYQYSFFLKAGKICFQTNTIESDRVLGSLGLDVSKSVSIEMGFSPDTIYDEFCKFIETWINEFNKLDFSKIDNYTRYVIEMDLPNPYDVVELKRKFKKCDSQSTEK